MTDSQVQEQTDSAMAQKLRKSKAVRNAIWLGVAAFTVYLGYVAYLFLGMSA